MEELPILGEPLPVELANTFYGEGDDSFDFLESTSMARLWMREVGLPERSSPSSLRRLRDVVHGLIVAKAEGRAPRAEEIRVLNESATLGSVERTLRWEDGWRVEQRFAGTRDEGWQRMLAEQTLDLLAGPQVIRRCAASDCTMLFVQQHKRRRFCHASCSTRMRQVAFIRRQKRSES